MENMTKKLKTNNGEEKVTQDNKIEEPKTFVPKKPISRRDCPYLSTIKRHLLDFDFEKLCSISLVNLKTHVKN